MGTKQLKAGMLPKSLGKFLGVENPYCTPGMTEQALILGCTRIPQQKAQGGRTYFGSEHLGGEMLAEQLKPINNL